MVNTKTCAHCKQTLTLDLFYKNKNGTLGVQYICKDCMRIYHANRMATNEQARVTAQRCTKIWRQNNRARVLETKRKLYGRYRSKQREANLRKYGITPEQYQILLHEIQGDKCAICGCMQNRGGRGRMPVDHDHSTGVVRGILCHHCNHMIGLAGDCVDVLRAAIQYLESPPARRPALK